MRPVVMAGIGVVLLGSSGTLGAQQVTETDYARAEQFLYWNGQ